MGAVEEIFDDAQRYENLANDYLSLTAQKKRIGFRQKSKEALIISPTHREGDAITAVLRERLQETGAVDRKEQNFLRLHSLNWTQAERRHASLYEKGMVVQFVRSGGKYKSGERFVVTGRDHEGNVLADDQAGNNIILPLGDVQRFQVYRSENLLLAAGDIVRISQNGHDINGHTLTNGNRHTVTGMTPEGHIRLDNGFVIDRDYGHLEHGYVVTSHASQGKTVDHVLICQDSSSFGAASPEKFYVSASRGREGVRIYTDDKKALHQAVCGSRFAMSASDLSCYEEEERQRRLKSYRKTMNVHWQRKRDKIRQMAEVARTRGGSFIDTLSAVWTRFTAPPPHLGHSSPNIHQNLELNIYEH